MDYLGNVKAKYFKRKFLYQYAAAISATLAIVCTGMHHAWPSPSMPILLDKNSKNPITNAEGSWIAAIVSIAGLIGHVMCTLLTDRLGRKLTLLLSSPVLLAAWLGIAYASSLRVLLCSRFLAGVGTGLAQSSIPMYIGEISDQSIRGLLSSTILVASKVGMLAINVIGIYFTIKTTALLSCIVPLLHFATFCRMPESPRFYIMKGLNEKAVHSLRKFTKSNNVTKDVFTMASSINKQTATFSARFLDMFRCKGSRKAMGIAFLLAAAQQLSGYFPLTFYCLTIFNETGGPIGGTTGTIIYFSVQLLISFLSAILIDVAGRRPLLIISSAGCCLALTATAIYFYLKNVIGIDMSNFALIPTITLMSYVVAANTGLTIIPVAMASELFPLNVKAMAMSTTNIIFVTMGTAVTKFFQIVSDQYGMHISLFVFAVCSAVLLIFIISFVPETKGKSLEEIQLMLDGSRNLVPTGRGESIPLSG